MTLSDVIEEYKFVNTTLSNCSEYFDVAENLINRYFAEISGATSTFFSGSTGDTSTRNHLIEALNKSITHSFSTITLLITKSYEFHGALTILDSHSYINSELESLIHEFIAESRNAIKATNDIIIAQLPGMKTQELLSPLIKPLQIIIKDYHTLLNLYSQLCSVNTLLMEPLPEGIEDSDEYCNLQISSNTKTRSFNDLTTSVNHFGIVVELINRLTSTDISEHYYIRKIETGSLIIIITGTTISITMIIKFIDFCFKKYFEYRKSFLEIKTMKQEVVKNDLEILKELLEITEDKPENAELIERATENAFNYFKKNPVFKLNGKLYNTGEETKLLDSSAE